MGSEGIVVGRRDEEFGDGVARGRGRSDGLGLGLRSDDFWHICEQDAQIGRL